MAKKTQNVVTEKDKTEKVVTEKDKTQKVLKFSKKQFVSSHRFAKHRDLVNVLLEDDKTYSIKEVEDVINNFLYKKKIGG